jgi:hypothetical protein
MHTLQHVVTSLASSSLLIALSSIGFGVMGADLSVSIYSEVSNYYFAGRRWTRCWQRYTYNEADGVYASTIGPFHRWKLVADDKNKSLKFVEGACDQLGFKHAEAFFDGSIPPAVILWCLTHHHWSPEWPKWVAARQEWNELVNAESERREKYIRAHSDGCPRCHKSSVNGNTFRTCYNCGYATCETNCRQPHWSRCPKCDEFCDEVNSIPNRTWKQKTIAMLQKKYGVCNTDMQTHTIAHVHLDLHV